HRFVLCLDDFKTEMELIQLLLEIERELIVAAYGVRENLADIADSHRARAAWRNRKHARLEMVALGPLHQPGVRSFASFLFKDLPALVLVNPHSVHHCDVPVDRVTANR